MRYLLVSLLLIFFLSCKKGNDGIATGTVIGKSGCFADSYLVAIQNPDFSKQPFLRPSVLSSCAACYDCSNAVFIRLSSSYSNPGTRIKFLYHDTQASCLSSSEAPAHITVKNLSRL
jgi:hypothetical protein